MRIDHRVRIRQGLGQAVMVGDDKVKTLLAGKLGCIMSCNAGIAGENEIYPRFEEFNQARQIHPVRF
ncbi:MAG: hypothetical protein C0396_09320, partial [Anaerolinea sp.]|nr:hypothetical protein [Anaerolinea sp.]